jgi:general stress protein 26
MTLLRRELFAAVPALGLASLVSGKAVAGVASQSHSKELYRSEEPAVIMAAAREIMKEDWVGVLITIDENGMPRARPVRVNDPTDDWSIWISVRRGSRKMRQIVANPKAALHFGFDDIQNDTKDSYYASFTGRASVHTDSQSIDSHGPVEQYRSQWPNYPDDLALIRFIPQTLEVMGKGIQPSREHWQPQAMQFEKP